MQFGRILRVSAWLTVGCSAGLAQTIVAVPGPYLSAPGNTAQATSWTASRAYTNVTITADVFNSTFVISGASLTTQIGPGATSAQQIATTTVPPVFGGTATLFTGLNLGPGTYYLVLMFNSGQFSSGAWQVQASASPITLGTGVTLGPSLVGPFSSFPSYGPSASFSGLSSTGFLNDGDRFMFSVTGDAVSSPTASPVGTPALSVWGLGGLAILLVMFPAWLAGRPRSNGRA